MAGPNFCGDYDVFSLDVKIFEYFSYNNKINHTKCFFRLSSTIDFSSVKEVDSCIKAFLHNLFVLLIILRLVVDHISIADNRDFKSRVA